MTNFKINKDEQVFCCDTCKAKLSKFKYTRNKGLCDTCINTVN